MPPSTRQKQKRAEPRPADDDDDHSDQDLDEQNDVHTSDNDKPEPAVSPTDDVLKFKSKDNALPAARTPDPLPQPPPPQLYNPPFPQYNGHPYPQYRPEPQPWLEPGPPRAPPYGGYPEQHHQPQAPPDQQGNVRLPSISSLLTDFNPPPGAGGPHVQRMPVYSDRQDWQAPPPGPQSIALLPQAPQQPYPPVIAPLPLDDSRARSPHPMPQRKRGRLPKETTDFLKAWLHSHSAHPYPSEIEKKQMCHATGLSMSQVSNWMINGRRRILGPSYLSTSRSTPHTSPPVTLSTPPAALNSSPVLLTAPTMMLRSPIGNHSPGP